MTLPAQHGVCYIHSERLEGFFIGSPRRSASPGASRRPGSIGESMTRDTPERRPVRLARPPAVRHLANPPRAIMGAGEADHRSRLDHPEGRGSPVRHNGHRRVAT